jgi:hypothetical protein
VAGASNTTSGAELSVDWLTDVRTQNVELYIQYHQSQMLRLRQWSIILFRLEITGLCLRQCIPH